MTTSLTHWVSIPKTSNLHPRVSEHSDQVEVTWLPRDSPEYNPDEFLDNDLNQNLKTKPLPETSEGFRQTIKSILEEIASMPERIKGYFQQAALDIA